MSQLSAQQIRALDPYAFLTGADGIDRVSVAAADILSLPYDDNSLDCVVAEAVTMVVDRHRAAKELAHRRKMAWS